MVGLEKRIGEGLVELKYSANDSHSLLADRQVAGFAALFPPPPHRGKHTLSIRLERTRSPGDSANRAVAIIRHVEIGTVMGDAAGPYLRTERRCPSRLQSPRRFECLAISRGGPAPRSRSLPICCDAFWSCRRVSVSFAFPSAPAFRSMVITLGFRLPLAAHISGVLPPLSVALMSALR